MQGVGGLSLTQASPDFYFSQETNERLFKTYLSEVVAELKRKIGRDWETFQTICVFRKFGASRISMTDSPGCLPSTASPSQKRGYNHSVHKRV